MNEGLVDAIVGLVQLGVVFLLVLLGWIFGRANERRHLADLERREAEFRGMTVSDLKAFPGVYGPRGGALVMGQAVIAIDYVKAFFVMLRKIVGGELRSYETLMRRARREALLRMLADARARGYNAVCNVRYETTDIGGTGSEGKKGVAMAGVFVFGTAYRVGGPSADSGGGAVAGS